MQKTAQMRTAFDTWLISRKICHRCFCVEAKLDPFSGWPFQRLATDIFVASRTYIRKVESNKLGTLLAKLFSAHNQS